MYKDLSVPWKEAIGMAWEAYLNDTVPIGAVLTDAKGDIICKGRNSIFDSSYDSPLSLTNMGHAEMNILVKLKAEEHPDVRSYTLYTTMEPCLMCFGAMVMVNIRHIEYGARDNYAGACSVNDTFDYVTKKGLNIVQGSSDIELFQLVLSNERIIRRKMERNEWSDRKYGVFLDSMYEVSPRSVELANELAQSGQIKKWIDDGAELSYVYDLIISKPF